MPGEHLLELLFQRAARQDAVHEIGAIEGADELDGVAELELRRDVAADARGRRRGERVQADAGKPRPQRADLPVLRTEVVAPLADAVGLVDRDVRHAADHLQEGCAPLARQPLGRNIQQRVPPFADAGDDRGFPIRRERAVVAGGIDAILDQRVDLVLHQRNERGDDES